MTQSSALKRWRTRRGLTQSVAAEQLGIRTATWCEWERGLREPGRDLAVRLEDLTEGDVPLDAWSSNPVVGQAMERNAQRRIQTPRAAAMGSDVATSPTTAPPCPDAVAPLKVLDDAADRRGP